MRLFRRVSDIISANLNDLVDRFEDPETMLRQAVREMEAAVSGAMDSAARAIANERLLERRLGEHRRQVERWQARARQSVRQGDDAVRRALVRKAEHQKLAAALGDELDEARVAARSLRRRIDAMRVRLEEARRRLLMLSARRQTAEARRRLSKDCTSVARHDMAFGRFERLCERVEFAEAEADALVELAGDGFDDDAEFDPEIEAELQAIKESRGAGGSLETGM